jgi:hypothetical protein
MALNMHTKNLQEGKREEAAKTPCISTQHSTVQVLVSGRHNKPSPGLCLLTHNPQPAATHKMPISSWTPLAVVGLMSE